jgi:2-C-methyl-D-erythritol 4-phosphate cytidylyltransferase
MKRKNPLSNKPTYFAVVPAAGKGTRIGSDIPKQYLPLLGKSVLRHTLEVLHSISWLQQIVLVHSADDEWVNEDLLASLHKITTTVGGSERATSVLNGLWALDQAKDSDWVLVHDAVRPCIQVADIEKLKTALDKNEDQAGILALPLRETLKRVDNAGYIESTVDRSNLWQAATPQQCRVGVLRIALEKTLGNPSITDEASALESQGVPVKVVQGHPDNLKITWPEDFALATAILKSRVAEHQYS